MNQTSLLTPPRWADTAIVYQIYPRSFKDSNNDGIGDLKGITHKLDYLNGKQDSLGINVIWISPFYKSPMRDFGYDVEDYLQIDPMFGTMQDFEELVTEAHKRDIKIMMDYIPNHTSDQNNWFIESKKSKDNLKSDWYVWRDAKPDGSPPNNWLSVFGGSAWEWDENRKQYYMHTFLKEQPDLNWRNEEVVKAMENVLLFWQEKGVDGFRMDAFYFIFKDEQFRDDPLDTTAKQDEVDPFKKLLHIHSAAQPATMQMIDRLSKFIAQKGDTFMVTELVTLNVKEMLPWYEAAENGLHAPFNFYLSALPWSARSYSIFIDEFDKTLQTSHIPTYVLSNHDVPRVVTRLGEAQARIGAMMLLTLKGMPYIYYGDELGMLNTPIPFEKRKDPFGKDDPNSKANRDGGRTPMQWNTETNAGFSQAEPWLPVGQESQKINVEEEQKDPHSMLTLYKTLINLRKNSKAIRESEYHAIDHDSVLIYTRESDEEKILVLLNFSNEEQQLTLPYETGKVICNTFLDKEKNTEIHLSNFILRPNEGFVLYV